MRVLVTGATGFVGSAVVTELVGAGHEVVGTTRSDTGIERLRAAGAEGVRGDVADLAWIAGLAAGAGGVVHTAFDHDPAADPRVQAEQDRRVIAAIGSALDDDRTPLVVTSGTGLVQTASAGAPAVETDPPAPSSAVPRAATEEAAAALVAEGRRAIVVRLPQVHDTRRQGRILRHILLARQQGRVAYIGAGAERLPAAHVGDVARLFRLALEQGRAGERFHAVAEEGVPLRAIADVLGVGMGLPVVSLTEEEAPAYFGPLLGLASLDLPASGAWTQHRLDWHPTGPDLLTDLRATDFAAIR